MSDIVPVSKDAMHTPYEGRVRYGAIFADEDVVSDEGQAFEASVEGAVPAVDWRGLDNGKGEG